MSESFEYATNIVRSDMTISSNATMPVCDKFQPLIIAECID
jgi:hypothetical protein